MLQDNKKIVIEEKSIIYKEHKNQPANPEWFEVWKSNLPENQCRYSIYDVDIAIDLGSGMSKGTRNKLLFIVWAPMSARIKDKMVTASSKDGLKKVFDGVQIELQINSAEEYEASALIDYVKSLPDVKSSGKITHFEGLPIEDW